MWLAQKFCATLPTGPYPGLTKGGGRSLAGGGGGGMGGGCAPTAQCEGSGTLGASGGMLLQNFFYKFD